jgi:hypothetical protein
MELIMMSLGGSLVAVSLQLSELIVCLVKHPPRFMVRAAAIAQAGILIRGF